MAASRELPLPQVAGGHVFCTACLPSSSGKPAGPCRSRSAYAAPHVVADPLVNYDPLCEPRRRQAGGATSAPSRTSIAQTDCVVSNDGAHTLVRNRFEKARLRQSNTLQRAPHLR